MLASPRLPLLESRSGRFLTALGFAGVVAVAALVHHEALLQPSPQQDEPVFVEAAERLSAGASPYSQERFNYPPPLAALGALALELSGPGLVLGLVRSANVLAVAAIAVFAAGFAGVSGRRRFALAAALVALLPVVQYTLWIGNLTPIAVGLALAGWQLGKRRPLLGAAWVGVSLAFKPIALVGALHLSARWLLGRQDGRRRASAAVEAFAWVPVTVLCLLPWVGELPALFQRMAEPPLFSSRNLSLRRVFDGFGIEMPAAAITVTVLAVALLLTRRRPVDDVDRVHTAPVVALLALPVAWAHGFLFVMPLQVAAARHWWERRARRREPSWRTVAERWGVPLALALIQASASAGVEFDAPASVRSIVVLLPMLSPLALLIYLRLARSPRPAKPGGAAPGPSLDSRP